MAAGNLNALGLRPFDLRTGAPELGGTSRRVLPAEILAEPQVLEKVESRSRLEPRLAYWTHSGRAAVLALWDAARNRLRKLTVPRHKRKMFGTQA